MGKQPLRLVLTAVVLSSLAARALGDETATKRSRSFSGRLSDINQVVVRNGTPFRIALRGLSYRALLERTLVQRTSANRVTLWLGVRNVQLQAGRTTIAGGPGSADCGPMQLLIGHRRPLWIAFDFAENEAADGTDVRLTGTRLRLAPDNWYVGDPAWVRTNGFLMTRERVIAGLRNGLARHVREFERHLAQSAPGILAQAGSQLPEGDRQERALIEAVKRQLSQARTAAGRYRIIARPALAESGNEMTVGVSRTQRALRLRRR